MGDNGGLEKNPDGELQKTPEQLASERLERYQKDPDSFVELNELIIAAIKNPKSQLGLSVMIGNVKHSLLDIAIAELNHMFYKVRTNMDIQSAIANQNKIQPAHGIINGARKLFGRK